MRKANVYIDDGYLRKILKEFGEGNYFKIDYNQLAISMTRIYNFWCNSVYFYTAPPFQSNPPTVEESRMKSGYDRVVSTISRIPQFYVREGRVQKIDNEFKQKGVDTLLTMDLMELVQDQKEIKTAVLLICDTDFVPILNSIRKKGIEVILFYYSDYIRHSNFSMSDYLLTACDKHHLIDKDLLMKSKFIPWPERHPDARNDANSHL